jgi:hypothetical protein
MGCWGVVGVVVVAALTYMVFVALINSSRGSDVESRKLQAPGIFLCSFPASRKDMGEAAAGDGRLCKDQTLGSSSGRWQLSVTKSVKWRCC